MIHVIYEVRILKGQDGIVGKGKPFWIRFQDDHLLDAGDRLFFIGINPFSSIMLKVLSKDDKGNLVEWITDDKDYFENASSLIGEPLCVLPKQEMEV